MGHQRAVSTTERMLTNSTTRRRGRHAAPPIQAPAPPPSAVSIAPVPVIQRAPDLVRLPGMELLGFYDEPYQIEVFRPPTPRLARELVHARHGFERPPEHTSQVAALWQTTELDDSALEWWKPQVIARRKLGGRRLRFSAVLLWGAIVLVVGLLGWLTLQRPGQVAEEALVTLRADVRSLDASIPPLRELALSLAADEAPDLAEAAEIALTAEGEARKAFTGAGELGADREAEREAAVAGASDILDASSRINRLVAYRLTAESALVEPGLPDTADVDLTAATGSVAEWRSGVESTLGELPAAVLPDHRSALTDWMAGLEGWQQRYLDAVREENGEAVRSALEGLQGEIRVLRADLLGDLAGAGEEIAAQIDQASVALAPLLSD